ncbi:MAG: hypothetical protein ACYDGO_05960 [Smithellaceae bacterium]
MKRLSMVVVLSVALMFFSAGSIFAGSLPDLTGKWKAKSYGHHHENRGLFSNPSPDGQWIIKKQEGRFFYGERSYTKKHIGNSKVKEGFSGVISRDGKRVYLVDHDEDMLIGDILPGGSIELIIMNDGDKNGHSSIGLIEIERTK